MTGTQVIANQGGCTCWCDDCHETHNCESWSQNKTLKWLREYSKTCPVAKQNRIKSALDEIKDDVPTKLLSPIRAYAKNLTREK